MSFFSDIYNNIIKPTSEFVGGVGATAGKAVAKSNREQAATSRANAAKFKAGSNQSFFHNLATSAQESVAEVPKFIGAIAKTGAEAAPNFVGGPELAPVTKLAAPIVGKIAAPIAGRVAGAFAEGAGASVVSSAATGNRDAADIAKTAAQQGFFNAVVSGLGPTAKVGAKQAAVEGKQAYKASPLGSEAGSISPNEPIKPPSFFTKTEERPAHQKALETASNAGDMPQVKKILQSIPDDDPYKSSMLSVFNPRLKEVGIEPVKAPLSTAPAKTIVDTYKVADDLKPVENKIGRMLKTQDRSVRKLSSEINKLSRKGADISLKDLNAQPALKNLNDKFSVIRTEVERQLAPTAPKSIDELKLPQSLTGLQANKIRRVLKSEYGDEGILGLATDVRQGGHKGVMELTGLDERSSKAIVRQLYGKLKVGTTDLATSAPSKQEFGDFVGQLVRMPPKDLKAIKSKIATRENKLGPVFDKIAQMSDELASVKTTRAAAAKEAKLLRRQGVDAEATEGVIKTLKTAPQDVKEHFSTWVNARGTTELEGVSAKRKFTNLDAEGTAAFGKIQSGDKSGDFGKLNDYFRNKYFELKEAGIGQGYQKNYLPQLWKDDAKTVDKAFGATAGGKPSFTIKKVISDYNKGIELGLEPRFSTVSDLVGWYEKTANRAIADKKFLDGLKQSGRLIEASKAPAGWRSVNPDFLPGKVYKAEPTIARAINNYLGRGSEVLGKAAHVVGRAKGWALGAGIPGTGLNWHGTVNVLPRVLLASKGPVSGLRDGLTTLKWMSKTSEATKYFDANFSEAIRLGKAGLTASTEEHAYGRAAAAIEERTWRKPFKGKVAEWQQKLFEDPLFGRVMPALKVRHALALEKEFIKRGATPDQAAKQAARDTNTLFGGINLDELFRDKSSQQLFRIIGLAPDFVESNVRLGVGTIKGFKNFTDPQYLQYRRIARNLLVTYIAANVINKAVSGHWMFQNDSRNQFAIETGTTDANGKNRVVPFLGGSVDFARLPIELAIGVATGDSQIISNIARGRLSPPTSLALSLISNTNPAKGNSPIFGPDKYGNKQDTLTQLSNVAQVVGGSLLPQQVQAGIGVATGKTSAEAGLAQALEAPVRYQSPKRSGGRVSAGRSVRKPRKGSGKARKPRRTRVTGKVRVKRARLKRTVTKA